MTTPAHTDQTVSVADRAQLGRRAQQLAAASVAYNAVEAVIAIAAGVVAGSVALVGFGLDDDNVHAPNEKFELTCLHNGIRSHAAMLAAFADLR